MVNDVAVKQGLLPLIVAAVCQTESNYRADAFRHEPQFWLRYMAKNPAYAALHPRRYSSSYGLMQVMWVAAVEDGHDATLPPESLFVPEVGLVAGCRRLKRCIDWARQFRTVSDKDRLLGALAAYNGGMNSSQAPPNPRNIKYALRVWQHLQELS